MNKKTWLRLLEIYCPPHLYEEIEGDLLQKFARDVERVGERKANRRLAWSVVRFFRPGIILRNKFIVKINNARMIRNYFVSAKRNLTAHKGNTLINVSGLVIGIASALVILTIIHFELGFDRFHTTADRTYRLVRVSQIEGQEEYRTGVSYPVPEALKNEIPGIEKMVTMQYIRAGQVDVMGTDGRTLNKFQESDGIVLVEPSFFQVFDFHNTSFKWIAGDPITALNEPFSVVLTRSMAYKYFGGPPNEALRGIGNEVLGQTLKFEQQFDFKVTGIIEDLPDNTDFPFTTFLSYSTFYKIQGKQMRNDWVSVSDANQSYVVLPATSPKEEVERQIARVHASHVPKDVSKFRSYKLQPLNEIHQDARFGNYNSRTAGKDTLWTLGIIGIFLMLTACINYINLATARSTLRSKEIGIRKVLGGKRGQLIFQFMSEAFLIVSMAAIAGLFVADQMLIYLQSLANTKVHSRIFTDPFILRSLLVILVVITFLAGLYPALIVSGFNTLTAIKNKLTSSTGGGAFLRKALVVFQFSLTQVFIICTFIVISQMKFFRSVNLGFNKEAIINISIPNSDRGKLDVLQNQLSINTGISAVSFSSSIPSGFRRNHWATGIKRKDADAKDGLVCEYQAVDMNYISLYGIQLVAGRNFNPSDSLAYVVINQTLSAKAGYKNPDEAIGQIMELDSKPVTVIGVMKDYHTGSLKEGINKVALLMRPGWYKQASLKFSIPTGKSNTDFLREMVGKIEKVWTSTYPEYVFDYQFFDENIKAYYQEESKFSSLLQIFSGIFLMIGCLGLYGLISFVVNRKQKEIAVRKIFGASLLHILNLISRDYIRLIFIAFLFAAPVTWYLMQKWLSGFTYHVEIGVWILIAPGLGVLVVALLAVSGQSLKAAHANPTDTLKYE